ncbi:Laminin subunit gamma-3 [Oryzias melastigma]|uniref:Laminin subunit gamma-3 n=1 Tax=Oryzias melastigma TaxID=30732 RepID=A0A834C169_ORYME|nr:Laminin subunit gamma-3 [Oryzias melastigma]
MQYTAGGVCDCSHFTAGMTCERCLPGYYGNALIGTPGDCQPCPCPDRSSCVQIAETGQVVCTNCPAGQTGMRCQMCEDGYYGDPLGQSGMVRACVRCNCNGNVDFNAVGICDHFTGQCLKCMGHTEGDHCQRCQRGFYGNALEQTSGQKCKPCSCSPAGTSGLVNECHPQTGSCHCLSHVTGRDCSSCEVGFFNLQPGFGCERCKCSPIGSTSQACHPATGECVCRPGVEGTLCDSCRLGFFGFSSRGCRACNCDPMGSVSMQCHGNGTCQCRQGFVGYKCDKCEVNYFHNRATHQCEECPVCYSLVKKQAEKLQARLQDLEKLLAHFDCREAREAFIKQFSSLEAATGTLSAQLHGLTFTLNCSISVTQAQGSDGRKDERHGGVCRTFTDALLMIKAAERRLKRATLDLDNMIFPFETMPMPNKWNLMVNESQVLMESHREMADLIEAVATRALQASKQTFSLLMDLLRDNSTEEYIRNLTEHQPDSGKVASVSGVLLHAGACHILRCKLNDTAAKQQALQEEDAVLRLALDNITSSFHQLLLTDARISSEDGQTKFNQTSASNDTAEWGENLLKKAEELNQQIQTEDGLIGRIREEMEPEILAARENLRKAESIDQLKAEAQELNVLALSSVVMGKEVEAETISLYRRLENTVEEWPHLQAQTKAAVKKEKHLREKVLPDVRRKLSQVEKNLQPAVENTNMSNNATKEAKQRTQNVEKESKAVLIQAKHTRTSSGHLSAHIDSALQQLSEQELQLKEAKIQMPSEPEVSLTSIKEDVETAKLQLEAYSAALTELISKIDGSVPLERFDRILNETARRLSMLRGSVESPTLSSKIQKLNAAAKEQRSRLSLIEQDIQEIREERDSLRDIALNLPQSCIQSPGAGKP